MEDLDKERFIDFWLTMSKALPPEGYGRAQKRVDPVEIAYQRYSEALLSWGVTVERRISDVVIGLESLLLSENDGLSYRLRLRVAKLLATIGFDPYRIRDAIKRAYEVRSAFLHGDACPRCFSSRSKLSRSIAEQIAAASVPEPNRF